MKQLIIALCMFPCFAMGQKLLKPEVDKFDGKTRISTTTEVISKLYGMKELEVDGYVVITEKFKFKYLIFSWKTRVLITKNEKEKVIFITKSGGKHEIIASGRMNIYSSGEDVRYMVSLEMKDIDTFLKDPITDIRFYHDNSFSDFVIKDKYQEIIPNICKLIFDL